MPPPRGITWQLLELELATCQGLCRELHSQPVQGGRPETVDQGPHVLEGEGPGEFVSALNCLVQARTSLSSWTFIDHVIFIKRYSNWRAHTTGYSASISAL